MICSMGTRTYSFIILLVITLLGGCAELQYYGHAVSGQLEVLEKRRPIPEVIADPATTSDVKQRLEYIEQAHAFAIKELYLPDSDSFRSYSDVERQYVLWNVFATPELSLQTKQWCYPVLGCLGYRSYFNEAYAQTVAKQLVTEGWDVHIARSPAYSTRGFFADPVYNPMLRYPELDIAAILFHELAHEKIYMQNDSQANESFAVAVQFEGIRRWLDHKNQPGRYARYKISERRDEEFVALLNQYRGELDALYRTNKSDVEKRKEKLRIFAELKTSYESLRQSWEGYAGYDHWFTKPLNNAVLAPVGTYHGDVEAFEQLLHEKNNNLQQFYREAQRLSELSMHERRKALQVLHRRYRDRN